MAGQGEEMTQVPAAQEMPAGSHHRGGPSNDRGDVAQAHLDYGSMIRNQRSKCCPPH